MPDLTPFPRFCTNSKSPVRATNDAEHSRLQDVIKSTSLYFAFEDNECDKFHSRNDVESAIARVGYHLPHLTSASESNRPVSVSDYSDTPTFERVDAVLQGGGNG